MNGSRMAHVSRSLRKFGPYFALAALVPGGSVLAVLLWFFRRKPGLGARPQST